MSVHIRQSSNKHGLMKDLAEHKPHPVGPDVAARVLEEIEQEAALEDEGEESRE